MNEVICSAEDINAKIYYQDTDSLHIEKSDLDRLVSYYNSKYGRELVGKGLGQFHSDFNLEGCEDVKAIRSIFLGKKTYIDELEGVDKDGNKKIGYHIRAKGIPNSCIEYTRNRFGFKNAFDMYESMYNGNAIEFDLTEQGGKSNFKFTNSFGVYTLDEFKRVIKF
jgi:hypothetical protein